jgi:hypothetical protein
LSKSFFAFFLCFLLMSSSSSSPELDDTSLESESMSLDLLILFGVRVFLPC